MYHMSKKDDTEVEAGLRNLAKEHPREGFWMVWGRLRLAGMDWNHKRVHRPEKGFPTKRISKRKPSIFNLS